jgi:hypothetical protein
MGAITMEFLTWFLAVGHQWVELVTGGFVTAFLTFLQYKKQKSISWTFARRVFAVFLFVAFFLAWRDQYEAVGRLSTEAKTPPPPIYITVPPAQVIIQGPAEQVRQIQKSRQPTTKDTMSPVPTTKDAVEPLPAAIPPASDGKATTPKPELAHVRVASQRTIISTNPDFPYALEAVIQTDVNIDPVAFAITCDGQIGIANAGFSTGGTYFQTKSGQINNDPHMFGFEWKSPAFSPDTPIVVDILSKEYIKVVGLQQIRDTWP